MEESAQRPVAPDQLGAEARRWLKAETGRLPDAEQAVHSGEPIAHVGASR